MNIWTKLSWEPSWQPFLTIEGEEEEAAGGEATTGQSEQQTEQAATTTETTTTEQKTETTQATPQPDWREKRLAQQTARIARLTAELEEARKAPASATTSAATVAGETGGLSEADVEARAAAMTAAAEFNRQCEETAAKGKAEFQDWDTRVAGLRQLADPNNPQEVSQYNQMLIAAMETGEGARLVHFLGGNLNEANRLLGLPPIKMAVELAKMAAKPPTELSAAPNPIRPVGARGPSHTAIDPSDPDRADNLDVATWIRRRTEQVNARSRR